MSFKAVRVVSAVCLFVELVACPSIPASVLSLLNFVLKCSLGITPDLRLRGPAFAFLLTLDYLVCYYGQEDDG